MNTTALVVEMIIVGFQVAIWLALLLAFGLDFKLQAPEKLEEFVMPLTFIGIAVCYTIGLVVDALTAWLEDHLTSSHVSGEEKASRRVIMQRLRLTHRELYGDLERDDYMLRLLRSTAFNLLIISVLGSILLLEAKGWTDRATWGYVSALVVLAVLGIYGWWRRRCHYVANRDAFYRVVQETEWTKPKSQEAGTVQQAEH